MNEIPRRSFLALFGATVVAGMLPITAEAAPIPMDVEKVAPPLAFVRRWCVTGIDRRCEGDVLGVTVWSARVRLQQIIMTEDEARKVPPSATIDYKSIKSACVDQSVEHIMTFGGPVMVDGPATAEIEMSVVDAMALEMAACGGAIEFAGDVPI